MLRRCPYTDVFIAQLSAYFGVFGLASFGELTNLRRHDTSLSFAQNV